MGLPLYSTRHCRVRTLTTGKGAVRHRGIPWCPQQIVAGLTTEFLDRTFTGGRIDDIHSQGTPLDDHVPASSLYNLFLAVTGSRNASLSPRDPPRNGRR